MKPGTQRLAERIGEQLQALALGEDFRFEVRWEAEGGPLGPFLVYQVVLSLPSPMLGQPRILAPVRVLGDLDDEQLGQMLTAAAAQLRGHARAALNGGR